MGQQLSNHDKKKVSKYVVVLELKGIRGSRK